MNPAVDPEARIRPGRRRGNREAGTLVCSAHCRPQPRQDGKAALDSITLKGGEERAAPEFEQDARTISRLPAIQCTSSWQHHCDRVLSETLSLFCMSSIFCSASALCLDWHWALEEGQKSTDGQSGGRLGRQGGYVRTGQGGVRPCQGGGPIKSATKGVKP